MRLSVHQWYVVVMSRGVRHGHCLLWDGRKNAKGYGRVRVPPELAEVLRLDPRTPAMVHRAIYAYHHVLGTGETMSADPVDHNHDVCRGFACYRLSHLRQVSHAVNQQRALEVRMYGKPSEWEEDHCDLF